MLFFNVLKKSFVIISRSINNISLTIANKALFLNFEFPFANFDIFGLLFIEQHSNDETVVDHSRHKNGRKFIHITKLQMHKIILIDFILVHAQVLEVSVLYAAGNVLAIHAWVNEELVICEDKSYLYAYQNDKH